MSISIFMLFTLALTGQFIWDAFYSFIQQFEPLEREPYLTVFQVLFNAFYAVAYGILLWAVFLPDETERQ